jgi:hypothetical protein
VPQASFWLSDAGAILPCTALCIDANPQFTF